MSRASRLPTVEQIELLRSNIHPAAHGAVEDWVTFPWHRDRSGVPDSHVPHSSQAFCMSVWGTMARDDAAAARHAIGLVLGDAEVSESLVASPELRLEYTQQDVLNEGGAGNPTNVDALLLCNGLVIVIESKLTESFGSCGQVKSGYCSGRYEIGSDLKTLTDAPCRLEVQDGRRTPRRYWEVIGSLSRPGEYQPGVACPFAGRGYQVMRTIAFASEFASRKGADWRVVFAFPQTLSPESVADVAGVARGLLPEHQERVLQLDYESLARALRDEGEPIASDLGNYMKSRMSAAAGGR